MPRKPRFFLPDIPIHAIVRGNDRKAIFVDDADKSAYLEIAKEASMSLQVSKHAYVLMDNHVHWLISSAVPENLSKFMQYLGRKYVPYFNHKYGKTGTLWEGRFKSSLINTDKYLLCCYQYIELNPVRAGMVTHPEDYVWSSYRTNALAESSSIITLHPVITELSESRQQQADAYREGFKENIESQLVDEIRNAVQTGTPLGGKGFREQVEVLLGVKVGYASRGRPKVTKDVIDDK